jgi:hypothetical protein
LCGIHRTGICVLEAQAASILRSSISPPLPWLEWSHALQPA